jgi:peptidoglycan/xylan/chitin deacetylase (PgdA/CDA1 family)
VGLLTSVAAQAASAADCPGHPDAIGTSRTIVVDPRAHPIIGTMQYAKTLPLADREVVLTFDDGPLPKYSNQILDILAAHCAKATFFLVGRQANANPEGVRKVRDAGHTVATHSQNHPTGMDRLPLDRSRQEIEQGIASVTAALADGTAPAPFLRIPGLRVNDGIEEFAASKGLQLWSADFPADDWRDVSANRVYELAMQRLEKKGKGILLLHDIQAAYGCGAAEDPARTESARLSHRPCGAGDARSAGNADRAPAMAVAPAVGGGGDIALAEGPEIRFCRPLQALPVPALSDLDWRTTDLGGSHRAARRGVPLPPVTPWPRQTTLPPAGTLAALPVPAASLFKLPESARPDPAGSSPPAGLDCAGALNGSLLRKARRQISAATAARPRLSHRRPPDKPRRPPQRAAGPPPSRRHKPNGMGDRFGSPV